MRMAEWRAEQDAKVMEPRTSLWWPCRRAELRRIERAARKAVRK